MIKRYRHLVILLFSLTSPSVFSADSDSNIMITEAVVVEFAQADYFWLTATNNNTKEDELYFCYNSCAPFESMSEQELLSSEGKKIKIKWQQTERYFPEGLDTLSVRRVISIEIDK